MINGVHEKLEGKEPSAAQITELEKWEEELDAVVGRLTDKGADIAAVNEAKMEADRLRQEQEDVAKKMA